jgi:transcriptional regulator with XRE-family HTH domain
MMILIIREFTTGQMPVRKVLKAFGFTVRRLRKARGLSQEELGFAAGLDRSYVGGIERGERNLSLVNLDRLASALSLSLAEMFREYEHGPIEGKKTSVRRAAGHASQTAKGRSAEDS